MTRIAINTPSSLLALIPQSDKFIHGLSVFCVGGAVRDALLGLPAGDRDWVVVGASPEDMLARGFIPVGGDFPVFLHPYSKEEYALARTERKSGRGYQGFTFYTGKDVSLNEDLLRRDFTINAMAVDGQGILHDPYHGYEDLQQGIFRHVGDAFIEDPVRILRLARFLSRFTEFTVAEETLALCHKMVVNHEVDALVPERVWKELSRVLMGSKPSRGFTFLQHIHALNRIAPGFCWQETATTYLDHQQVQEWHLSQRYAMWIYLGIVATSSNPSTVDETKSSIQKLSKHLRVAREQVAYAVLLPEIIVKLKQILSLWQMKKMMSPVLAQAIVSLIEQCDGIRKPVRLLDLLHVALVILGEYTLPSLAVWEQWLSLVNGVDVGSIAQQYAGKVQELKQAIHTARIETLLS